MKCPTGVTEAIQKKLLIKKLLIKPAALLGKIA
jgi:hypothetical protein